jgi:hypothetical protein
MSLYVELGRNVQDWLLRAQADSDTPLLIRLQQLQHRISDIIRVVKVCHFEDAVSLRTNAKQMMLLKMTTILAPSFRVLKALFISISQKGYRTDIHVLT